MGIDIYAYEHIQILHTMQYIIRDEWPLCNLLLTKFIDPMVACLHHFFGCLEFVKHCKKVCLPNKKVLYGEISLVNIISPHFQHFKVVLVERWWNCLHTLFILDYLGMQLLRSGQSGRTMTAPCLFTFFILFITVYL